MTARQYPGSGGRIGPCSQAEGGDPTAALWPALDPAGGALELELGRVWSSRPPPGAGRRCRGLDHALGEQRVIGLLGSLKALLGLLVGARGGVVGLTRAGVLGLPRLALAAKPDLAVLGLLLETLLALCGLAFDVALERELTPRSPPGTHPHRSTRTARP